MPFQVDLSQHRLKLFNTASRRLEELIPLEGNHVRMYTCGPTVYNQVHIGNLRTFIFEDLLRRTIKFFGMKITQVMNLTDVDDKTIKGAIEKGISLDEYTQPYKDGFFHDLNALHIEKAEKYPAATEYIDEMIAMIQSLLDKGVAYKGNDGSIYYAIKKFPRYGCLSHLNLDELQVGASERVSSDEYEKENVSDFVLWKAYEPERDGKIFWKSPFGDGRPGWHLECSAMAMKLLGETIDIHCGGIDNMFPHHENEIAQSEAHSGKQFVKIWMHAEHLVVDGKKMSKSLKNFYTLQQLKDKGYTGPEIRFMLMQTHYKHQLNFTFPGLDGVRTAIGRLQDFTHRMQIQKGQESSGLVRPVLDTTMHAFAESLANDLNISAALAALFDMVREINTLCDQNKVSESEAHEVIELLKKVNTILDVLKFEEEAAPTELLEALQQRQAARKSKDWALADSLRDLIYSRGYVIEDTPAGSMLKKVK